jgi:hypothetical protein
VKILERLPAKKMLLTKKKQRARVAHTQNTSQKQKEFDNQKPFVSSDKKNKETSNMYTIE